MNAGKLNEILNSCIREGSFEKECLIEKEDALESLVTQLSLVEDKDYQNWSREKRIEFWINTHTIWLLRILADLPPDQEKFQAESSAYQNYKLMILGRPYSLAGLADKVWTDFRDERLFFLLGRGTEVSPPLPETALEAVNLERDLHRGVLRFIRDPERVRLDGNRLYLSPFFKEVGDYFLFNYAGSKWLEKTRFKDRELAVLNFLYHHGENEETRSALERMNFKIEYLPINNQLKRANS